MERATNGLHIPLHMLSLGTLHLPLSQFYFQNFPCHMWGSSTSPNRNTSLIHSARAREGPEGQLLGLRPPWVARPLVWPSRPQLPPFGWFALLTHTHVCFPKKLGSEHGKNNLKSSSHSMRFHEQNSHTLYSSRSLNLVNLFFIGNACLLSFFINEI